VLRSRRVTCVNRVVPRSSACTAGGAPFLTHQLRCVQTKVLTRDGRQHAVRPRRRRARFAGGQAEAPRRRRLKRLPQGQHAQLLLLLVKRLLSSCSTPGKRGHGRCSHGFDGGCGTAIDGLTALLPPSRWLLLISALPACSIQ